jgi:REP element-mobilizing transposase RayT
MSHTYISDLVHIVFSTKNRRNLIPADTNERLWSFMGGIARKNGFKAIAVGGTENHVHALLSLPATMPLSKAVQLIKGASSKWMNDLGHNFALARRLRCLHRRRLRIKPTPSVTSTRSKNITASAALKKSS